MQIDTELKRLDSSGLLRSLNVGVTGAGKYVGNSGVLLNFSSNDYLNLSSFEEVKREVIVAINKFGCSASASRLMSGSLFLHKQLEEELAGLLGMESALVFGSGFLCNLGVVTALAGKDDEIFADKLNHASLVDAMKISGAKWQRYPHCDMQKLRSKLEKSVCVGQKIIITDSVFSMDGDIAPLRELRALADEFGAMLIVDEAHAIGVFGERGQGVCAEVGICADLVLGTLSKALASYGGFVACSAKLREYFINFSRTFIYSTALPPSAVVAASTALRVMARSNELRKSLFRSAKSMHDLLVGYGFVVPEVRSPIIPIHIGDNKLAVKLANAMRRDNIWITAIRPPTVPVGTARLRLSITLAHNCVDIEYAAKRLAKQAIELGVISK